MMKITSLEKKGVRFMGTSLFRFCCVVKHYLGIRFDTKVTLLNT